MSEVLCKLYLELANVVPADCISSREIRLGKIADTYGLALMMIAEGAADQKTIAREALNKVRKLKP
jgi:hypothetical protein